MKKKAATKRKPAKKKTAKRKLPANSFVVKRLPLTDVKPYEKNPRDNEHAVEAVAQSLVAFGWQQPLVVDKDHVLIVGHTRRLAALWLQSMKFDEDAVRPDWLVERLDLLMSRDWRTAPVRVADELSVAEVRAYRLADNKTGEAAAWDAVLLPLELDSVLDSAIDFKLSGFAVAELDDMQKAGVQQPLLVDIEQLKEHPRNYREHPADQLQHIIQSIEDNGVYRNIVIARDNTILAGHGVVKACRLMTLSRVPVIRLNIAPDDARALKIVAGDNEVTRLAAVDDRVLTEMLKDIATDDVEGLLGTGFDSKQLAALAMVTRPVSEVATKNEAEEWVGMPDWQKVDSPLKVNVQFRSEADREKFAKTLGITLTTSRVQSIWYPARERDDIQSVIVEDGDYEDDSTTG